MSAAYAEPLFTFREWSRRLRDTRDKSYQRTRLGADVMDYLAWKRKSRASERTLDQYERDLRLLCLAVGCDASGVTHLDLIDVLDHVPPGSWKRVREYGNPRGTKAGAGYVYDTMPLPAIKALPVLLTEIA